MDIVDPGKPQRQDWLNQSLGILSRGAGNTWNIDTWAIILRVGVRQAGRLGHCVWSEPCSPLLNGLCGPEAWVVDTDMPTDANMRTVVR